VLNRDNVSRLGTYERTHMFAKLKKHWWAGTALGLVLGLAARAQEPPWNIDLQRLGLLKETSTLLGHTVHDPKNKTVGKVDDLVVHLGSGQVVAVLVSSGGRTIAIPALSFLQPQKNMVMVSASKQLCESAPPVSVADRAQPPALSSLSECFQHFSQKGPLLAPARAGELGFGGRLLGRSLVSQAHEALGQVKEVMIDLAAGRMVYLVIAPVAGKGADYYLVPPVCVQPDADGRSLVLKADRVHFAAGPHFQNDFWSDMAFPNLANAVLQHYQLSAAATEETPSPGVRSDKEILQAVFAEIIHEAHGMSLARIGVTALHGRVILTGTVNNEKQKRVFLAAAARVVGPENVEDHLDLWRKSG